VLEREDEAPALAIGVVRVGGVGLQGITFLSGSVGGMEKGAPALAIGAVRVGGAGVRGITCLGGSVGGMEKGAPALAMGAVRWAVQEREPLPWWQGLRRWRTAPVLAMGAVRVGGAGVRGITCLGGSVGGMEKVAPALAMGAVRVGGAGV
jgi:hypothetical protein